MSDNIVTIQSVTISITVTIQSITISITVTVTPQPQPLKSLFSLQREHFKHYKETACCACRTSVLSLLMHAWCALAPLQCAHSCSVSHHLNRLSISDHYCCMLAFPLSYHQLCMYVYAALLLRRG